MVLVSTISPMQAHRDYARARIGEDFMEVYVKADLATCQKRDPKKLYQKLAADGIENFTGVDAGYEAPQHPDLVLDTMTESEEYCTGALLEAVAKKRG